MARDVVVDSAPLMTRKIARAAPMLLLALALLAGAPGRAAASLEAWAPDPAARVAGEPVTFMSHSPFSLADVGGGPEVDPPQQAQGTLFLPQGASAEMPVPAVVLLHGSRGVSGARELTYGRELAAMGVAALVIDAFAARRDMAQGFTERLLNITEAMLLADAYAGLRWLSARPDIDDGRVALVGFSYGAMAATYAAYVQVAERFAPEGARFAGHAAFYGPCIARFEDRRATGAPVLMLWGDEDEIIDPERCAATAEALRAGGAAVETIVYEGAVHQWDGGSPGRRRVGRTLAGCDFAVGTDGIVRDGWSGLAMTSPLSRRIILALCVGSDGYLIGRDDAVRARSNRDLGRFLAGILRKPGGTRTE